MNLDDPQSFRALDPEDMLGYITALPDQLEAAWQRAHSLPLPETFRHVRQIVLNGMGGSAIGGDLLAALIADRCPIPILVNRDYVLPAFAAGPETLVIASSKSGGTEETLYAFDQALERGVQLLAIATGGALIERARAAGVTCWDFTIACQPRAALGWSFGLLIGLADRLGLAVGLDAEIEEAVELLRQGNDTYGADVPLAENPAKRLAGQFCGRVGVFYGGGILAPVARRWKAQFNENAKSWAEFDALPEMNHNGTVGTEFPAAVMDKWMVIFLRSAYDHPRVHLRHDLTRRLLMTQGINTDTVTALGETRLAQMLSVTQYGDYASYYLAMMNGVDPTPVPQIDLLKEGLATR